MASTAYATPKIVWSVILNVFTKRELKIEVTTENPRLPNQPPFLHTPENGSGCTTLSC